MKQKIEYIVAKTKLEAQTKEAQSTMEQAKQCILPEELNQKYFCFAKRYNEKTKKNDYIVVSYFDIISPLGEMSENMQWFDAKEYIQNEQAKKKFKSLKV